MCIRDRAIVSVRLSPKTPEAVQEFMDAVWDMDETIGITLLTGSIDVQVHISAPDVKSLGQTVLSRLASAPNVADEQTNIVLEHRRKAVLTPLVSLWQHGSVIPGQGWFAQVCFGGRWLAPWVCRVVAGFRVFV